jgi:hypothetical protein
VHLPTAVSNLAVIAGRDPARAVGTENRPREDTTEKLGRAYRSGRLVCGCVRVTVSLDGRLGLAPHERRVVRVRFHEPLDDGLRSELAQLVRWRGAAARRAVERLEPVEVVVEHPYGVCQRIVGRLQPPQVRHGRLRDIEFGLRDLTTR